MLKTLISSAAALAVLAGAALAQEAPISQDRWESVQSYLERNPRVLQQLEHMMAREITPDQIEADKTYIKENAAAIFEDPMSPVLGNPDGEITVVKFSDYRCIHCKKVTPELEKLIAADPRVKVIIKEFPILGPDSLESAKFALAARMIGGDEAFEVVEEMLFETNARITGYLLEDIAAEAGLDPRAVIEAMDDPRISKQIQDTFMLAQDLKIQGTPGLIIGDRVVRGGIPFEAMQQGIAEAYPEK